MIAVLFGLLSAMCWGMGDFAGGISSRRTGALKTVLLAEFWGLLLLLISSIFVREPYIHWRELVWSLIGGATGSVGLVLLYKAMIRSQMSISAAVSSVTAAALPILVSTGLEGFPGYLALTGILLALAAIWLVSQSKDHPMKSIRISSLVLPLLSGLFFGVYFILMHLSSQDVVIWPIIAARISGAISLTIILIISKQPLQIERIAWPYILLAGTLDVGGNLFYILSGQVGRLDIAAILGSLYAGVTVLLAWIFLKERISRIQWLGNLLALVAIIILSIQV